MITSFGKEIRRLRLEKDSTLKQMAFVCQVSSSYLSAVEHGKKLINNKFLSHVVHYFNLTTNGVDKLMILVDESQPYLKISLIDKSINERKVICDKLKGINTGETK